MPNRQLSHALRFGILFAIATFFSGCGSSGNSPSSTRPTDAVCDEGLTACDGHCTVLREDPRHCGACGSSCREDEVCSEGECRTSCGSSAPDDCSGSCVNLSKASENCGACGHACRAGQLCSGGVCAASCGGTTPLQCGDECVDPRFDRGSCGRCDNACESGLVCSEGRCQSECSGERPTICGDQCVDLSSDRSACGACENACSAGEVCVEGSCASSCPVSAPIDCEGRCVDLHADPAHCGGCNLACARDLVCSDGDCVPTCQGSHTACDGRCVDLTNDPRACGGCAITCDPDQVCQNGACADSCTGATAVCGRACVDTSRNPRHCGSCGVQCVTGAVCVQGKCAKSCADSNESICTGYCVDTGRDEENCGTCGAACEQGKQCQLGECVCAGATPDSCGGSCTDRTTDPLHCGKCDNACLSGQECVGGKCLCPGGDKLCDGTCVDTKSDEDHCGGCDEPCPRAQSCVEGECECPSDAPTACENSCVDTQTNERHCGGCFSPCGDGQNCASGKCRFDGRQIEAGWSATCALLVDGRVKCWGQSNPITGDLTASGGNVVRFVDGFSDSIVALDVGGNHACALLTNGSVECFGSNSWNLLGTAGESSISPVAIDLPEGRSVEFLEVSYNHSGAILDDGTLLTWGINSWSELGHDGTLPALVEGLSGAVIDVSSGQSHMCARLSREDGAGIECWGIRSDALGLGTDFTHLPPTAISGLTAPDMAIDLSRSLCVGNGFSCATVDQGDVACWGSTTSQGQMGYDTSGSPVSIPGLVPDLPARARDVVCGQSHACALLESDELWCWGQHYGAGSTPSMSPALVLQGVEQYFAGPFVSFAKTNDGEWLSWGNGQIALGRIFGNQYEPLPCCTDF